MIVSMCFWRQLWVPPKLLELRPVPEAKAAATQVRSEAFGSKLRCQEEPEPVGGPRIRVISMKFSVLGPCFGPKQGISVVNSRGEAKGGSSTTSPGGSLGRVSYIR